jgi:hypothetical protein
LVYASAQQSRWTLGPRHDRRGVDSRCGRGTLAGGFRISYLVATGIAALGIVLVVTMLNARQCQLELAVQSGANHAS